MTSTPETEINAAFGASKGTGLPSLDLWDKLLQRTVVLQFHEDNTAMISVCLAGKNPSMKHLSRVHRMPVGWICAIFNRHYVKLFYEVTATMCANFGAGEIAIVIATGTIS